MALSTFTLLCMLTILNDTQINKATISFLSTLVCISVGQDGVGYALVTKAPMWSFFSVAEKKNKAFYLVHATRLLQVSWELCPTWPSLWEPGRWERCHLEYCWLLLAERKEWQTLYWLLKNLLRDFWMVQWLKLPAPEAGGLGAWIQSLLRELDPICCNWRSRVW